MKARFNTRGAKRPGVRLIAGLSALGFAAGLLTGCSNKDPDDCLLYTSDAADDIALV